MPKVIFLAKRSPELNVEEFHSAFYDAAQKSTPPQGCNRYVQSHTLVQGYKKGELLYDALEEAWFEDLEDARAFLESVRAGRHSVGPILNSKISMAMLVEPHIVKDEHVPKGAVKNIEFVNRRPGLELKPFQRYWKEVHGPIGAQIPTMLRYEQNHCTSAEYAAGQPRFDGLAITWFASTKEMRAGVETEAYVVTRDDERNFLPDGHLPIIITTEVIDTGLI